MRRATTRFSKPVRKFQYGGDLKYGDTPLSKDQVDYEKQKNDIMSGVQKIGGSYGGLTGGLISLGVELGKTADSNTTDEFGVEKSGIENTIVHNMWGTGGVDTAYSQFEALKRGDFEGVHRDALSLGTFGLVKSTSQKEKERARDEFKKAQRSKEIENVAKSGALAYNSLYPKYKAPAYGRDGMKLKFKSKFARV